MYCLIQMKVSLLACTSNFFDANINYFVVLDLDQCQTLFKWRLFQLVCILFLGSVMEHSTTMLLEIVSHSLTL